MFDESGSLIGQPLVKAGIAVGNDKPFWPEQRFVAVATSPGCFQGDAIRRAGEIACLAQFEFTCASNPAMDIEVDIGRGATVGVKRTLAVTSKWTGPLQSCVDDSQQSLSRGESIDGILDGETIHVVVQATKLPLVYEHDVDVSALRKGKTDAPSVDVISKKGRRIGQTHGPLSLSAAEALKVAFRRKRAG